MCAYVYYLAVLCVSGWLSCPVQSTGCRVQFILVLFFISFFFSSLYIYVFFFAFTFILSTLFFFPFVGDLGIVNEVVQVDVYRLVPLNKVTHV